MTFVTVGQLSDELRLLGITTGSVLLVHASLSRLGHVIGGEQAVIQALRDVVGPDGTLVMPAQSWQLCDPAYLGEPDVRPEMWDLIRTHLPAYDPLITPTRTMGRVAELFRTLPNAKRSTHPHRSFAALGPHADTIVAQHDLDNPNGERSPLKTMYDLGASTLLLGVGHAKSTILHLAEHRSGTLIETITNGAPLMVDGSRRWVVFDEIVVHDHDFDEVGQAFAADTGQQRTGPVGNTTAHLVPHQAIVDYAATWFATHRTVTPSA